MGHFEESVIREMQCDWIVHREARFLPGSHGGPWGLTIYFLNSEDIFTVGGNGPPTSQDFPSALPRSSLVLRVKTRPVLCKNEQFCGKQTRLIQI